MAFSSCGPTPLFLTRPSPCHPGRGSSLGSGGFPPGASGTTRGASQQQGPPRVAVRGHRKAPSQAGSRGRGREAQGSPAGGRSRGACCGRYRSCRSDTPERSIKSSSCCLKSVFESPSLTWFPSPRRRGSSLLVPMERRTHSGATGGCPSLRGPDFSFSTREIWSPVCLTRGSLSTALRTPGEAPNTRARAAFPRYIKTINKQESTCKNTSWGWHRPVHPLVPTHRRHGRSTEWPDRRVELPDRLRQLPHRRPLSGPLQSQRPRRLARTSHRPSEIAQSLGLCSAILRVRNNRRRRLARARHPPGDLSRAVHCGPARHRRLARRSLVWIHTLPVPL